MTTTEDKITIPMSDRRPLRISKRAWPLIANVDRHDGEIEIRVREHADGRRVVYGWLRAGKGGVHIGWRGAEGGFLIDAIDGRPDDAATIRAIRRVGGIINDPKMADACIADMPAEEDDAAVEAVAPEMSPLTAALALLSQAHKHCPPDLQREIYDFLSQGA